MNEPNARETSQIVDIPPAEFQPPFLDDSVVAHVIPFFV